MKNTEKNQSHVDSLTPIDQRATGGKNHPAANTDDAEPIEVLRAVAECARCWEGGVRLLGNVRACDIVRAVEALDVVLAALREVVINGEGFDGGMRDWRISGDVYSMAEEAVAKADAAT